MLVRLYILCGLLSPLYVAPLSAAGPLEERAGGFTFQDSKDRLEVYLDKQAVATFLKSHPELTRRGLVNVATPAGIPVTRNFPPKSPDDRTPGVSADDGIDHRWMHPGIWLSFGDLNGQDYWRMKAKVIFDDYIEAARGNKEEGSFAVRDRLMTEDGKLTVCIQETRYQFRRSSSGFTIVLDASFRPDGVDFYFGDQEESGLGIRVGSAIRVKGGSGSILNDRGEKNEAQVWGKEAKWVDFSGIISDRRVGLLVIPGPVNPRPSWIHARDYGVLVANPFPRQPKERREPYTKTWVKKGETYRLVYAIVIHESAPDEPFDLDLAVREGLKAISD